MKSAFQSDKLAQIEISSTVENGLCGTIKISFVVEIKLKAVARREQTR
jgi:hypothetical protein